MKSLTALPILLLAATTAWAAKPTSCSPSPVKVTFADDAGDKIKSDGGGSYVNGEKGVTAVIYDCPGQSGDMVLNTGTGTRKSPPARSISFDFTDTLPTPSTPSTWPSTFSINFLNIWKVMKYQTDGDVFTTGAGAAGFPTSTYYLRFQNPNRTPPNGTDPNVNEPCVTALIDVTHYPVPVGSTAKEHWVVSSSPAATLCNVENSIHVGSVMDGNGNNAGQARLPFHLTIEKLN